jgi:hypothetical protein
MRTAEQIFGSNSVMTVKDLKKILKKMDDDAVIQVPSHCSSGYYSICRSAVEFNEHVIHIGN